MSIATVVSLGYGDFGSVGGAVTLGYSIGQEAASSSTGAFGATEREAALIVAKLLANKRLQSRNASEWLTAQRELERLDKEKRAELRATGDTELVAPKPKLAPAEPKKPGSHGKRLPFDFAAVEANIAALQRSIEQNKRAMAEHLEREEDEDDFEAILFMVH